MRTSRIPSEAWKAPRSCSRCGRISHRIETCRNPESAIHLLGVEVEGVYERARFNGLLRENIESTPDGSITTEGCDEEYDLVTREFRCGPGSLGQVLGQVHTVYPDHTNRSCGMHVHMSFKSPLAFTRLATNEFQGFLLDGLKAWGTRKRIPDVHEFWKRLRGENTYCQIRALVEAPGQDPRRVDRYSVINPSAWREGRKTLEIRVLPMFRDESLAQAAIKEVHHLAEAYLARPVDFGNAIELAAVAQFTESATHEMEVPAPIAASETSEASFEVEVPPPVPAGHRRVPVRALLGHLLQTIPSLYQVE